MHDGKMTPEQEQACLEAELYQTDSPGILRAKSGNVPVPVTDTYPNLTGPDASLDITTKGVSPHNSTGRATDKTGTVDFPVPPELNEASRTLDTLAQEIEAFGDKLEAVMSSLSRKTVAPERPRLPVAFRAGHDMPEPETPLTLPGGFDPQQRTAGKFDQAPDLAFVLVPVRGIDSHSSAVTVRPVVAAMALLIERKLRQQKNRSWEGLTAAGLYESLHDGTMPSLDRTMLRLTNPDAGYTTDDTAVNTATGAVTLLMQVIDRLHGLDTMLEYLLQGDF